MNLTTPSQYQERYIKSHYPQDYLKIISGPGHTWREKLYLYMHNMDIPVCPICGKPTNFLNSTQGYTTYCSKKCASISPKKLEKTRKTCLEQYGVPRYTNRQKFKQTCLDRYGVSNPNKLPEVREKIAATNLDRYDGVGFASKIINQKTQNTLTAHYGAPNIQQVGLTKKYPEIILIDGPIWTCSCPHPECTRCTLRTFATNQRTHYTRRHVGIETCTVLNPIKKKQIKDTWIELFVRELLDKYNIKHIDNSYSIVPPKELDIYLPDYHIAIECNGVYHHSDKRKPAKYHLHKKEFVESKNIHLISIWEDQICNKPEIIGSIILSKIGIYERRLGARQCQIITPTYKETLDFLNENHIQGSTTNKIRCALKYKDEMVAVMTFIQSRGCQGNGKIEEGTWELNRFCTKRNVQVIGAADKLLKYFIRQYHPTKIVSFSHNDISWGDVYSKLGFIKEGKCNTSYYYISPDMHRYHRSTFTKSGIVAREWKPTKDSSWTEREVMDEHHYLRIYDSGTQKWVLNL